MAEENVNWRRHLTTRNCFIAALTGVLFLVLTYFLEVIFNTLIPMIATLSALAACVIIFIVRDDLIFALLTFVVSYISINLMLSWISLRSLTVLLIISIFMALVKWLRQIENNTEKHEQNKDDEPENNSNEDKHRSEKETDNNSENPSTNTTDESTCSRITKKLLQSALFICGGVFLFSLLGFLGVGFQMLSGVMGAGLLSAVIANSSGLFYMLKEKLFSMLNTVKDIAKRIGNVLWKVGTQIVDVIFAFLTKLWKLLKDLWPYCLSFLQCSYEIAWKVVNFLFVTVLITVLTFVSRVISMVCKWFGTTNVAIVFLVIIVPLVYQACKHLPQRAINTLTFTHKCLCWIRDLIVRFMLIIMQSETFEKFRCTLSDVIDSCKRLIGNSRLTSMALSESFTIVVLIFAVDYVCWLRYGPEFAMNYSCEIRIITFICKAILLFIALRLFSLSLDDIKVFIAGFVLTVCLIWIVTFVPPIGPVFALCICLLCI